MLIWLQAPFVTLDLKQLGSHILGRHSLLLLVKTGDSGEMVKVEPQIDQPLSFQKPPENCDLSYFMSCSKKRVWYMNL